MGALLLALLPLIPDISKLVLGVIAEIKARNPGMTIDQILDKADIKLADNERKLLEDLARLEGR